MNEQEPTIETAKMHAKNKSTWTRGFFMLIFTGILGISKTLVIAVSVFQFLHVLLTGSTNKQLFSFSSQFCAFIQQTLDYLLYLTDDRPFPFADWPASGAK